MLAYIFSFSEVNELTLLASNFQTESAAMRKNERQRWDEKFDKIDCEHFEYVRPIFSRILLFKSIMATEVAEIVERGNQGM